jgi:hypothetical protein
LSDNPRNSASYYGDAMMTRFPVLHLLVPAATIGLLIGCTPVNTADYSAKAITTYVWRVEYDNGNTRTPDRIEDFTSTALTTYNSVKPEDAVTGPDEKGLYWPALPPKPTLDEVEKRASNEKPGAPLLHQIDRYEVSYNREGKNVTVPTNYDVYRTVSQNAKTQTPLKFILGVDDQRVEKAELSN